MVDRINLIADILMGAAYADHRLAGEERAAVKRLLADLLKQPALPLDLAFRLDEFDPATFDLGEAAAAFVDAPEADKKVLLGLAAAVHAADAEHDFEEDEYLRWLGAALGLPEAVFSHLLLTIVSEVDLATGLEDLRFRAQPPL